ncbi:MAG: hypothetical protein ACOY90_11370 [Candidatus Zhuqueibacterota bacterium]
MKFFLQQYTILELICQVIFSTRRVKLHDAPGPKFVEIVVDISGLFSYIHGIFHPVEAVKAPAFSSLTATVTIQRHFVFGNLFAPDSAPGCAKSLPGLNENFACESSVKFINSNPAIE